VYHTLVDEFRRAAREVDVGHNESRGAPGEIRVCELVWENAMRMFIFDTAAPSLILCPNFTGFEPGLRLRYQSSLSSCRLVRMSLNLSGPMSM